LGIDGKRDQEQSSPHCFIDIAQRRHVIAREHQLVRWLEIEKITVHETRGDVVTAGQVLDRGFVPTAAFGVSCASVSRPLCSRAFSVRPARAAAIKEGQQDFKLVEKRP